APVAGSACVCWHKRSPPARIARIVFIAVFIIIFLPEAPVLAGTAPKVKQKMKIFENIWGGLRRLRTGPALPGATASASEQARIELEGNWRLNMDALEIGILGFNRKFGWTDCTRQYQHVERRSFTQRSPVSLVDLDGEKMC